MRIGVYGAAGTGTSTFLNLLEKQFAGDSAIAFAKFKPWLHTDESHIFQEFYLFVAKLCGATTTSVEMLAPYAETMAAAAEMASPVPGLTAGLTKISSQLFTVLLARDSLVKNKDRIKNALEKSEKRIVVAVDELDCLSDAEIQKVFQFIKLAGCFPDIGFVVACDEERALKALAPIYGGAAGATDFMTALLPEKYDLPAATSYALSELMVDQLHSVANLKSPSEYLAFSAHEHRQLIKRIDRAFGIRLKTPRQVKLYASNVAVKLKSLTGEVDSLEFALVEAIRYFYPSVYKAIRENSELFIGANAISSTEKQQRARNRIAAALDDLPENERQYLIAELARLFPIVAAYYELSDLAARQTEETLAERQAVASKDYFYRYFDCQIKGDDISDNALKELLTKPRKRRLFQPFVTNDLAEFVNAGGTALAARKIKRLVPQIPLDGIEDAIEATAYLGRRLSSSRQTAKDFEALNAQLCETIRSLLERLESVEARDRAALKIVQGVLGTEFAMRCAMHLSKICALPGQADVAGASRMPLLSKNGVNELYRKIARTPLRNIMPLYKFTKDFFPFYETWQQLDRIQMNEFLTNEVAQNPRAAINFLTAAATSEFGALPQTVNVVDVQNWFRRIARIANPSIIAAALRHDVQAAKPRGETTLVNDDCKLELGAETVAATFLELNEDG